MKNKFNLPLQYFIWNYNMIACKEHKMNLTHKPQNVTIPEL